MTSLTDLATSVAPRTLLDPEARVPATGRDHSPQPRLLGAVALPRHRVPVALLLGDLGAIAAGLLLVDRAGIRLDPALALALPPLWLVLLATARGYQTRHGAPRLRESARRVLQAGAGLLVVCLAVASLVDAPAGPGQLLFVTGAFTGTALLPRTASGMWAGRAGPVSPRRTRVMVAGHHLRAVERTMAELARAPRDGFDVVSACLARPPRGTHLGVPVHVGLDRLAGAAAATGAEAVIVLPCQHVDAAALRRIGWDLEATGTHLFVGTPLLDVADSRTSVARVGGLRMLHVRAARRRGPALLLKSALELLVAVLLLTLLLAVFAAIMVAIRWDSRGPALYRQTRIGRDGHPFTMYKFRTMCVDADASLAQLQAQNEADGLLFKIRRDPRVTRVGRLLRRYSLDELPQLLNVVLGQMSLVGPRPALPVEAAQYSEDARRRLLVKPGLTGLWQVSGRSDLSWEDGVRLDLQYVDNWSLALDLSILCRTAGAVLAHDGAY